MHTLLRPVATFALVLSASLNMGQTMTENYIELTVTDTLSARVKSITYSFTPQAPELHGDAVYEDSDDWEKVQKRIEAESREQAEKLKRELVKEGFRLSETGASGDDYTITSYDEEGGTATVYVNLSSEAELKRLVAHLRTTEKGNGHVSSWEYEPTNTSEVELMQRMHARAAEQARTLATLGGRKLGRLITAQAPGGSTGIAWLDAIMGMAREELTKGDHGMPLGLFPLRQRTITFRFELVD